MTKTPYPPDTNMLKWLEERGLGRSWAGGSGNPCHAVGSAVGAGMPVSPVVSPAPEPAPGVYSDGARSGVSTGAAAHTARDSAHSPHQSPPRATAPHSCGCPATRLASRRRTLLLSRSSHRAPLHFFLSAAHRPPVASRRRRRPGPVQLTTSWRKEDSLAQHRSARQGSDRETASSQPVPRGYPSCLLPPLDPSCPY